MDGGVGGGRTVGVDDKVKLKDLVSPSSVVDVDDVGVDVGDPLSGSRLVITAAAAPETSSSSSVGGGGLPAAVLASPINGQFYVIGNPSEVLGGAATAASIAPATASTTTSSSGVVTRSLAPKTAAIVTAGLTIDGGSSSGSPSQPKDLRRRITHNEVERRRRDNINTWIERLGKLIPDDEGAAGAAPAASASSNSNSKSRSKGDILARACEFLTELREANAALRDRVSLLEADDGEDEAGGGGGGRAARERLERRVEELRADNALLRETLRDHGLVPPPAGSMEDDEADADMVDDPASLLLK